MDNKQFDKFIDSLLKGKPELEEKNKEEFDQAKIMSDNIIHQFAKESSLVDEERLKELKEKHSLSDLVDILRSENIDIQQTLENFFIAFKKVGTVDVQGHSINTTDFYNKWKHIQKQFEASEKFEDDLL